MPRKDEPEQVPSIVVSRDDAPETATGRAPRPRRSEGSPVRSGGSGILARLVMTVSLVVAAVACAWAWQLEEKLTQTGFELERQEKRLASLESLLSDTDESVSQSAAQIGAELRLLDSEVRKLWDARKDTRARVAKLEKTTETQATTLKDLTTTQASKLETLGRDVAKLNTIAGDLDRLMTTARSSQADIERVADRMNELNLEFAKLEKRVEGNEGWISSINAFRRQVNTSISQLEAALRNLQQPSGSG